MSQAKVDRYKEEKKNRKTTLKKEKRKRALGKCIGVLAAIAVVCWIGYSGYSYAQNNKDTEKIELSTSALDDYLSTVTTADDTAE